MITLLLLIDRFNSTENKELKNWIDTIEDHDEYLGLVDYLDDMYGIELTDGQIERLWNTIESKGYISAFNLKGVA